MAADEGETCVVFGNQFGEVFCIMKLSEGYGVDGFAIHVDCAPFANALHYKSPLSYFYLLACWPHTS